MKRVSPIKISGEQIEKSRMAVIQRGVDRLLLEAEECVIDWNLHDLVLSVMPREPSK